MGRLNYREDKHLNFLSKIDNESLTVLVSIITKNEKGKTRSSEDLTLQERYKQHSPDHSQYWDLIAADYQYFGGNTLVSTFRRSGILYEEILNDTCKEMKVNFPKNASVEIKETNLLLKTMETALEEMSDSQRKEFLRELGSKNINLSKQATMAAIQAAVRMGGFASYQLALVVANGISRQLLGHGLKLVANAGLVRAIGIAAGPIGWAVTAAWTAVDLAGPAKRITIPATIYIASLRQAELNKQAFELKCPNCSEPILNSNAKFCPECGVSL